MSDLAIIIPAYKIDFFKDTLDSLARQTCKDFTVYIGDDCSPDDFKSLIAEYKDKIHIVYCRFDENLGGKDLVGHWKRCIDLTQNEPWLWLFSDDDVIGERCVELFYKEIEDGTVTVDRDIEITPDTVSLLIDLGFIEEDDAENDLIDFDGEEDNYCEELANLYEEVGAIEARVTELEETWESWGEELKAALTDLKAAIKEKEEPKAKTASPKKK
jgi:glycosyltransferase involved in cell wall biosynthesis